MNARHGLWWWVAGCLLLCAGPALAGGEGVAATPPIATLRAASLATCEGGIALLLEADRELTYEVFRLENPARLVIDLIGLRAPLAVTVPPGADDVRAVRYSLWRPDETRPIVRYVLESSAPLDYQVEDSGPVVTFTARRAGAVTPMVPATLAPREEYGAQPSEEPAPGMQAAAEAGAQAAAEAATPAATAEASLAPPPEALSFGLVELIRMAERGSIGQPSFAPRPTGPEEAGCTEVWGEAVVLGPSDGQSASPEAAPAPIAEEPWVAGSAPEPPAPAAEGPWVAASEAEPTASAANVEEHVAETESPGDYDLAVMAEEPARVAEADEAASAEPAAADEPMVAPRSPMRDRFDEIVARHREAAELRAHRNWSQNLTPHDNAPLLGDADADFPAAGSSQSAPMSLDVQGADIHTVLRSLAEYAGVNIVADKDVAGRVTLRALDLPWPEMLRAVCRSMGLVAIDHGRVIRVATERVAQEEAVARESAARKQEDYMPLQTRIVPLRYAQAAELKDLISTMRGTRGQVEVDPRTNAMILTDIGPRLDLLEETLHSLDSQTMQVEITAEIVDVDFTEARALGIIWGIDNYHSASANASGTLGITASDVADPAGTAEIGFLRSFGEVHARIEALANDNKADIISTPRITTVNNREARILVGKEVPLITMDEAGNAITELKKVGITLEVTPYVNSEDQITLDLHPEVSDLSSQSTVQGGVVFTTTQADARVMVREGETAVIGGLIRTLEGKLERGVPLIKDVPVVGQLFKHREDRQEKRELLIFVTPRLVRASTNAGGQG